LSRTSSPRGSKECESALKGIEEFFGQISHQPELDPQYATGNKGRGDLSLLAPADYLIQLGIGVGQVLIGSPRADVWTRLGRPHTVADGGGDSCRSGMRELRVNYRGGVVDEISVDLSKFHTAEGLTSESNGRVFRKMFTDIARFNCITGGPGSAEEGLPRWIYLDAVADGIAMMTDEHMKGGALIVHRPDTAVGKTGNCIDSK